MPTPASGTISLNDIGTITKGASGTVVSLNDSKVRTLLGIPSGQISLSQAYNKPASGTASQTVPGTYSYAPPPYQYLTADCRGGGGGGGGQCWLFYGGGTAGGAGGATTFFSTTNVVANGGGGGGGQDGFGNFGAVGTAGGGSGGTVTTGGGAAGGASGYSAYGQGGTGGNGGKTTQTWTYAATAGYPEWGTSYTYTVGAAGARCIGYAGVGANGQLGAPGAIYFTYS